MFLIMIAFQTGWMEGPHIDINPAGPELTGKLWNEGPGPHRWPSNQTSEGRTFHYADQGDRWNELETTATRMKIKPRSFWPQSGLSF